MLAWQGRPSVVNPLLASVGRRKTDVLDARLLARHALSSLWPAAFIHPRWIQTVRVLMLIRKKWRKESLRCLNQCNNIILRWGHTFGAETKQRPTTFIASLRDLVAGRRVFLAGASPLDLPEDVRYVIDSLVRQHEHAAVEVKALEQRAQRLIVNGDFPIGDGTFMDGECLLKLLRTVPGCGPVVCTTWLTEVYDVRRFETAARCVAYCGSDPTLKVSAGKTTEHVRRGGNMLLAESLKHAAAAVVRADFGPLGEWGRAIRGRHTKGGWRKALGAVARRLAICLYHVQRTGQPLDLSGYHFHEQPQVPDLPVHQMDLPTRYLQAVMRAGYTHSSVLASDLWSGALGRVSGIGEGCLAAIQSWVETARYRSRRAKDTATRNQPSPQPSPRVSRKAQLGVTTFPKVVCESPAVSSAAASGPSAKARKSKRSCGTAS